ncbi:uncharacterized protein VTP21DRAFT_683 [Calcarisporiella thermophila]|uniref:uncharacterized protein n=1 Tax=Calcarisporiella thermophila TaxID=911321 RepID=UPI003742E148
MRDELGHPSQPNRQRRPVHFHPLSDVSARRRWSFDWAETRSSVYNENALQTNFSIFIENGQLNEDAEDLKRAREEDGSDSSEVARSVPDTGEGLRRVIVHRVEPDDTLAGVALSYGVEIAMLKRMNKLWANDSIHMRKYIYIPIEDLLHDKNSFVRGDSITFARRMRHNMTPSRTVSSDSAVIRPVSDRPSPWRQNNNSIPSPSSSPCHRSALTEAEIQTLPASQLSFFPPPRRKRSFSASSVMSDPTSTNNRNHPHASTNSSTSSLEYFSPSIIPRISGSGKMVDLLLNRLLGLMHLYRKAGSPRNLLKLHATHQRNLSPDGLELEDGINSFEL